jgi:ribose transport system substrate-binding protein
MSAKSLRRDRGLRALGTLALAAGLACGACSRGTEPGDQASSTFALVPKAMNNPFFDRARDGCKQAEAELDDVECLYIGPGEHTEQEQVQIVEDLITRRVDGIAVAPSNAPAIARALVRARDLGIPVLTWDSDLLPEDRGLRQSYVGTRNEQIGVEQARVLQRLKPEGGTLCIQSGGPAAANHNERMQGLRDTLAGVASEAPPGKRLDGAGGWREVAGCPLYSHDDFPLAVGQLADVLGKFTDLDAFVATGGFPQFVAGAYRQAVERHRERVRSGSLVLVVADTLPMQMELLREGLSHAQVGQRPFEMGYRAMVLLHEIHLGAAVPEQVYTGLDVCLAEDADGCPPVD